jgi:excisionase family DNA binding protein
MTPNPDEPEYLKVEEVAVRLKVKEKTIRDWIVRGELPAYKLGKDGASAATTSTRRWQRGARPPSPPARAGCGIPAIPGSPSSDPGRR